MSRFMHIFKCQVLLEPNGEPMQVVIDANENVNGTLVLPVWEGSDGIASGNDNGINRILKIKSIQFYNLEILLVKQVQR